MALGSVLKDFLHVHETSPALKQTTNSKISCKVVNTKTYALINHNFMYMMEFLNKQQFQLPI